jgi:hypothetical protein
MRTIPFVRWIANAAACLTGPHGAVTDQAQESGNSRQSAYDHAQKVLDAVEAQHSGGPTPSWNSAVWDDPEQSRQSCMAAAISRDMPRH